MCLIAALRVFCLPLAAVLAIALHPGPSLAADRDAMVLTGPAGFDDVSAHLDYTLDPDWRLTIADFVGPSPVAMQPLPGPRPDFGYTTAKVWLRVRLVNGAPEASDWLVFMPVSFLQRLAIHRIDAGGAVDTLVDLTEDSPYDARPIDYPQIAAPFTLEPGQTATLVVSYYSLGAARHMISLETPESFAAMSSLATAKNYAFYGMMAVMIALAMVAMVALRQFVFAAYAAYAASILVYIAHSDGTAFQQIWPTHPQLNSMAAAVTGSGVMVFSALFAMSFLQTKRYHPVMHRVLLAIVFSVLALDAILWTIDPKLLNRLLVYMILVSVLACVVAGLVAARTRFREVRFYVLAWSASLIPAALFTARLGFGVEPGFITPYDAIRLALILDALMMGLAIFDRYNHLRQTAMEETLAHARRNLALGQRLAVLEEQYAKASALAQRREESVKDTVHDLRQPMHALRLSLRQMFSAGRDKTDAGQVESALGYMERLVAERLADQPASGMPSASSPRQETPTPAQAEKSGPAEPGLHGVLRGVADMFAPEAVEKGLELRLVLAAPDAGVAAYPLMRVAANLVSNAIKYTREGRIVVALRRDGAGHRVEVHDTGPGLGGVTFDHALQRNQRLDRDRDYADGSGLGLAVVKEIADANAWRISACDGRRTGASIRVVLPATAAP